MSKRTASADEGSKSTPTLKTAPTVVSQWDRRESSRMRPSKDRGAVPLRLLWSVLAHRSSSSRRSWRGPTRTARRPAPLAAPSTAGSPMRRALSCRTSQSPFPVTPSWERNRPSPPRRDCFAFRSCLRANTRWPSRGMASRPSPNAPSSPSGSPPRSTPNSISPQ